MQSDLQQILIAIAFGYLFFIAFALVGSFFLRIARLELPGIDNPYGYGFYCLVFGLIITCCVYSLIITAGATINILIVPLLALLVRSARGNTPVRAIFPWLESLWLVGLSIVVLYLFPESEYKQNDSFYYLKIAEALNATGQENTLHYYNNYSKVFHGTEPYHYFELWCASLITRCTAPVSSTIMVYRFVVQGIFIAGFLLGLYNLVRLQLGETRYWHKLFCWSLVFFMPDIITYFPGLSQYLISNIEGNLLERPNFRVIYLFLVGILALTSTGRPRPPIACFWLLTLAVVSFKFTILLLPGMVLYGSCKAIIVKQKQGWYYVMYALVFVLAFWMFYFFTGAKQLTSFYETPVSSVLDNLFNHWKGVLFAVIASIGYILIVSAIFLVPLFAFKRRRGLMMPVVRRNSLLVMVAVLGVTVARVLFMKDNAYQFLFAAHIIAFCLIWIVVLNFLSTTRGMAWVVAAMLFASPFVIKQLSFGSPPDIFEQNGQFVYSGKKYSEGYIRSVTEVIHKKKLTRGAYIADSGFYKQVYYSRRNPNVYFLPITYILSKKLNGNIDFCLSDSAAIMSSVTNPVHADYLQSAIRRSIFFQYRKQHPGLDLQSVQKRFIKDHGITYLVATPGVSVGFADALATAVYVDAATGERMFVLR